MVEISPQEAQELEHLAKVTVDVALQIHRDLGPGLLESVYETLLARGIEKRGSKAERQVPIRFVYDGVEFPNGFRADILVEGRLIVEVKAVEQTVGAHVKQLITYVQLAKMPLGLLLNFGTPLLRMGMKRVVNYPRGDVGRLPRAGRLLSMDGGCDSGHPLSSDA